MKINFRSLIFIVLALGAFLGLTACDVYTVSASKITSHSARLSIRGDCSRCLYYLEYTRRGNASLTSSRPSSSIKVAHTLPRRTSRPVTQRITETITHLTPSTVYQYKICGRRFNQKYYLCVNPANGRKMASFKTLAVAAIPHPPTVSTPATSTPTVTTSSSTPVVSPPPPATSSTAPSSSTSTTITPPTPNAGNNFAGSIFGVAVGSTLQNEDGTSQLTSDLNEMKSVGAGWARLDINWAQIQNGGPTSYNWTNIDDAVKGVTARGMNVLGVIVYTPNWSRPPNTEATLVSNTQQYANFAALAAQHYWALGVHSFEIWNEENNVASWTPAPNAKTYTTMLQETYTAIKKVEPNATIISGGLSPAVNDGTNIAPVTYLQEMYADGAHGYFDAVGFHPYANPDLPSGTDSWSAWYQMFGTSPSIRSVMIANGDSGLRIWGTEFGSPSQGASSVSEQFQAQTISQGYQLWESYPWAGPLFVYNDRDTANATDAYDNYGLEDFSGAPKPAYTAYQNAVSSYSP